MIHPSPPFRAAARGGSRLLVAVTLSVTLTASLAACGGTPADVDMPRRSISAGGFAAGDEITADSVHFVRFDSLVWDSRCPREHVCVWAGDVELQLSHRLGRGASRPFRVRVGFAPRDTVIEHSRLTVDSVTPHARFREIIAPDQYRVWMSVQSLR